MKDVERVNQIIEDYFAPIGGYVKVSCSLDFFYDPSCNEMAWSFLTEEPQDTHFAEFFEKTLGCKPMHYFIYSLFHEYGHKMTIDQFSEEERVFSRQETDRISEMEDAYERDMAYFNLDREIAASRWAADYINAHYEEIAAWAYNFLIPALDRFVSNSAAVAEICAVLEEEEDYE